MKSYLVPKDLRLASKHSQSNFDYRFGELFLRLAYPNVKTAEEKKRLNDDFSNATLAYSAAIIGSLKGMFILRALIKIISADNCIDGAFLGYLVSVTSAIFGVMHPFFENRPVRLYLLHQGYHIFCFTICGAVLAR